MLALPVMDSKRYKNRNTIEGTFGRLKDSRRIAMGYDKIADIFMAAHMPRGPHMILELIESGPELGDIQKERCR